MPTPTKTNTMTIGSPADAGAGFIAPAALSFDDIEVASTAEPDPADIICRNTSMVEMHKPAHRSATPTSAPRRATISESFDRPRPSAKKAISIGTLAWRSGVPQRSSMTVRTLDESLHSRPSRMSEVRRNYRKAEALSASINSGRTSMTTTDDDKDDDPLQVSFHSVEIREYPIRLGDNPSASKGLPITIDWCPTDTVSIDLDEYEEGRTEKRENNEMVIPPDVRKDLIKSADLPQDEVRELTKIVNVSRAQRRRTNEMSHLFKLEEALERAKRKLRGILKKNKKRKERDMISDSLKMGERARAEASIRAENEAAELEKALEALEVEDQGGAPSNGVGSSRGIVAHESSGNLTDVAPDPAI